MICPRCHRLMIFQRFYREQEFFDGWKCLYCGEIIDPVILENRFRIWKNEKDILRERRK